MLYKAKEWDVIGKLPKFKLRTEHGRRLRVIGGRVHAQHVRVADWIGIAGVDGAARERAAEAYRRSQKAAGQHAARQGQGSAVRVCLRCRNAT